MVIRKFRLLLLFFLSNLVCPIETNAQRKMERVAHAFNPSVSADATTYGQYTGDDPQIPGIFGFDSDSQSHSDPNLAGEIDLIVETNGYGVSGSVIWDAQARVFDDLSFLSNPQSGSPVAVGDRVETFVVAASGAGSTLGLIISPNTNNGFSVHVEGTCTAQSIAQFSFDTPSDPDDESIDELNGTFLFAINVARSGPDVISNGSTASVSLRQSSVFAHYEEGNGRWRITGSIWKKINGAFVKQTVNEYQYGQSLYYVANFSEPIGPHASGFETIAEYDIRTNANCGDSSTAVPYQGAVITPIIFAQARLLDK